MVHTVKDMALDAALKVCYMYGILSGAEMANVSEKFVQSLWGAFASRLALLAMPIIASFGTWLLWEVYTTTQEAIAAQAKAISEIQNRLQDHEFRLSAEERQRSEFQQQTLRQFQTVDQRLQIITDKLEMVNDAVIRVQTIIETRLPSKSVQGGPKWSQQ